MRSLTKEELISWEPENAATRQDDEEQEREGEQCNQIERFLKVLSAKLSFKSSPNVL